MTDLGERIKQLYEPKHYDYVTIKGVYGVMLKCQYVKPYEVKK